MRREVYSDLFRVGWIPKRGETPRCFGGGSNGVPEGRVEVPGGGSP